MNILKYFFTAIIFTTIFSCSEPLDAGKVTTEQIDLSPQNIELSITAPKGAKLLKGAEEEDMMLYKLYSCKVHAEDFKVEVMCFTMSDRSLNGVLTEKLADIKNEDTLSKIVLQDSTGFIYESNEINDEQSYGFCKIDVRDNFYVNIIPEPQSDGTISLEEAKYMYEILNK